MISDPHRHHRRSIRLRGYDYAQPGAYFVTVCTHRFLNLFGEVVEGQIRLNHLGRIVAECWEDLPNHYRHICLDEFVVMPDHVHGIICLGDARAGLKPAPTDSDDRPRHGLPEIVRGFKTFSSRRVNEARNARGTRLWQRNYYEHVIRNEAELDRTREYIVANPARSPEDEEPENFENLATNLGASRGSCEGSAL